MNTGSPHLCVTSVTKHFDHVEALRGASLNVDRGETLALLGPSGCGKTTLLRIIAGLTTPDSGSVTMGGTDLIGEGVFVRPEHRRVGMVFQGGALFPHMTVAENVGYGLAKSEDRDVRVREALSLVDLVDLEGRAPSGLSGGQAQRVALARALAPRPDVLLLDEPFASLDAELRVRVRSEVTDLLRRLEITAVFVTHDQEEAFVVGDHVAVMRHGEIIQSGTPGELYDRPVSAWMARFVGDANVLSGLGRGATAETAIGSIPLVGELTGACDVVVRPEHVVLRAGNGGVVGNVEFYGHDTAYAVRHGEACFTARAMSAPIFSPGDDVVATYEGPPAVAFAAAATTEAVSVGRSR